MKMKKEHYKQISDGINEVFEKYPEKDLIATYKKAGLSKTRFAWDILRSATIDNKKGMNFVCDTLYKYLNDIHIETAIFRIVKY